MYNKHILKFIKYLIILNFSFKKNFILNILRPYIHNL